MTRELLRDEVGRLLRTAEGLLETERPREEIDERLGDRLDLLEIDRLGLERRAPDDLTDERLRLGRACRERTLDRDRMPDRERDDLCETADRDARLRLRETDRLVRVAGRRELCDERETLARLDRRRWLD